MEPPYINRELSWLRFNERVLEQAADTALPPLERLRFIAIFASNLDEFFMIRVGGLAGERRLDQSFADRLTGMTAGQTLDAVYQETRRLTTRRDELYADILAVLAGHDMVCRQYDGLSKTEKRFVRLYFRREVLPLLSPQIVDARHPFPHMENKALYAVVGLKADGSFGLGVVPVPHAMDRLLLLPDGKSFLLCQDILLHRLPEIFPNYRWEGRCLVRVTRNADLDSVVAYDDDEDFRGLLAKKLKKREKLAPVRLQMDGKCKQSVRKQLISRLALTAEQVFREHAPLSFDFVGDLSGAFAQSRALLRPPIKPRALPPAPGRRIASRIAERDLLLAYPYDSMAPLIRLLDEAGDDPQVLSIKMTLYRLGPQSQIGALLCAAAENGKDVTVVLELRARFDERNNLGWAARLEESGCRVIYGLERLKVHAKLLLLTRREAGRLQYITHVGTGNFNEQTARQYTDFSLFSARRDLGEDAVQFFQNVLILNLADNYHRLIVAPGALRAKLLELIDGEIAKARVRAPCGILAKMNALTDKTLIDRLLEAARAGVGVRLIVRGVCCLLPDAEHGPEVISIVGRFLEHSRVFCFGADCEAGVYLSSADWMPRNLDNRLEATVDVTDAAARARLVSALELMWRDNVKAYTLQPDGSYVRRAPGDISVDSQALLLDGQEVIAQPNRM